MEPENVSYEQQISESDNQPDIRYYFELIMFAKCMCLELSSRSSMILEIEAEPRLQVRPIFKKKGGIKLYGRASQTQLQVDNNPQTRENTRRRTLGGQSSLMNFNIGYMKEALRRDHPTKFTNLPDELRAQKSCRPAIMQPASTEKPVLAPSYDPMNHPYPLLCSIDCLPIETVEQIQPYSVATSKKFSTSETITSDQPASKLDQFAFKRSTSMEVDQTRPLFQSNFESPKVVPIIEQSIIVIRTVLDNFQIVRKLHETDEYSIKVAIEKKISMVVNLKVYTKLNLDRVTEELNTYKALKDGHPGLLRLYNGTIDGVNGFVMIREYYQNTLRDLAMTRAVEKDQLREYAKQLITVFEFLCENGILLPNVSPEDIAIVNGLCKLINVQKSTTVKPDSQQLSLYYIRKLADIIRSVTNTGSFMPTTLKQDVFGCASFLQTLQTEHLNLRLVARHPYLN